MVCVCGKSEQARKLAASHQSPFKGNSTAKLIIPKKRFGQSYDSFVPVDKKMSKELTAWVKCDPYYKTPTKKTRRCPNWFYHILRTPLAWLNDGVSLLLFTYQNEHWISIWISIPKKHIVIWDSIHSHISPEDLDVVMEPFVTMVLYLLVKCAGFNEQRVQYTLEPYTYERLTIGFSNKNAKAMREKMALDIFKETPGCHSKENKDNDENISTYDEEGLQEVKSSGRLIIRSSGVKSSGRLTRRSSTSFLTLWTRMSSFFADRAPINLVLLLGCASSPPR
ncbi:hypothetical protein F2Q69_00027780 [Brassica cretica]|uniref:Ubiquitin-like protease family profile domain-containing protein n=1 Tax=Brassica cretica TaxID=69181 RepID=A0A8S9RT84_BRACR|nr:hypothetical protein F2Q69_00027780 [Brassica cretica]